MKTLSKAAQEARRKYRREWARRNKSKIQEYAARHWERKAQEMQQEQKQAEG